MSSPLAPVVQKYIDEELSLKTQLPNLRLSDAGVLSSGEQDTEDLFASVRAKASSLPDVIVGPDSNPTLSYTSGSEGKPKAVLGRHYGLTRYFPWMAERFNLSSESVFACLSGIAHDPIQRGNSGPWPQILTLMLTWWLRYHDASVPRRSASHSCQGRYPA